jgi:hypothetical protein
MQLDEYDPVAKGLGLQYVLRGRFRNIYVRDTPATGLGCDFLQDTVVEASRPSGAAGSPAASSRAEEASASAAGGAPSGWPSPRARQGKAPSGSRRSGRRRGESGSPPEDQRLGADLVVERLRA